MVIPLTSVISSTSITCILGNVSIQYLAMSQFNSMHFQVHSGFFLKSNIWSLERPAQWQICQFKCKSLNSIGLAKWQTCQLFEQSLNYNVKNKTDKLYHNNFETNGTPTQNQLDEFCDSKLFRTRHPKK